MYSFIGESNILPVKVEQGKVWLDERPLDLSAGDAPAGPATLYFRPNEVDIGDALPGAIQAVVAGIRRHAGTRRVDLAVSGMRDRIEIELPTEFKQNLTGPITVLPRRFQLFT